MTSRNHGNHSHQDRLFRAGGSGSGSPPLGGGNREPPGHRPVPGTTREPPGTTEPPRASPSPWWVAKAVPRPAPPAPRNELSARSRPVFGHQDGGAAGLPVPFPVPFGGGQRGFLPTLLRRAADSESPARIADRFGVARETVRNWLSDDNGLEANAVPPPAPKPDARVKYTPAPQGGVS